MEPLNGLRITYQEDNRNLDDENFFRQKRKKIITSNIFEENRTNVHVNRILRRHELHDRSRIFLGQYYLPIFKICV